MTLLDLIASDFGVVVDEVDKIVRTASHRYKTFHIPKRHGGQRTIHHPSQELKGLQRWVHFRILSKLRVHRSAMAYRPGVSARHNALEHAGARYLLRLDMSNFFPSLSRADVVGCLSRNMSEIATIFGQRLTQDDLESVARITCRKDRLTIGAPTSPCLSNLIMYEVDSRLSSYCDGRGITYTRYADDLYFSTEKKGVLFDVSEVVERCLDEVEIPQRVALNHAKTHHSSKGGRQSVTGLVLTCDGRVSIGRQQKRILKCMVHQLNELGPSERRILAGWLSYCKSVEPSYLNYLVRKYSERQVRRALRGYDLLEERAHAPATQ